MFSLAFLVLSIAALAPLAAANLAFTADVAVNNVTFSWKAVDGASWYDLYRGQDFVVRLPADQHSYTIAHLDQNEDYSYILGARDSGNATLDAEEVSFTTGSYDGTYVWTNPTDRDNGGKLKEIRYTARLREDERYGQYMEISVNVDGVDHVIFPLQGLDGSWPWIDWDDDGPEALAYRLNCEKFNRLGINPSEFRTRQIRLTGDSSSVDVASKALGIEVVTTSSYVFGVDDVGRYLEFTTTGGGLALSALYRNPTDSERPHTYVLRLEE